jgi:hypothetical protein
MEVSLYIRGVGRKRRDKGLKLFIVGKEYF